MSSSEQLKELLAPHKSPWHLHPTLGQGNNNQNAVMNRHPHTESAHCMQPVECSHMCMMASALVSQDMLKNSFCYDE